MADYLIHDSTLEDIADAIRSKTGGSSLIVPEDMPTEIASISGGGLPTGMTYIGSGTFTLASNEFLTVQINHGLPFTPKAILVWTSDTTGYGFGFGYLTRELIYNSLTNQASRNFVTRINSSSGYEILSQGSTDASEFITDTYFTFNHGSRRYIAGATYYWFAFA